MHAVKETTIPPEFRHLAKSKDIPWESILGLASAHEDQGMDKFEAFTDSVIEIASKECMKEEPDFETIQLGMEACLVRGRLAEGLFISTDSDSICVLSLRAIIMFIVSDIDGLRQVLKSLEDIVDDDSNSSDLIRLATVKVLLAAAERDTSVIMCVMEFDNLLETYPEQVEKPLTETMFALYVVGALLREVGQASRAIRIADTLEDMAESKGHRPILALTENLRGNICNLQGDIKNAEEHYLKFLKISEELSFDLGIGMAYNNLGTLKLNTLDLETALEYFQTATQYMIMDAAKLVNLANLGELLLLLGRYEEAEPYLEDAARLEEKTKKGIIEAFAFYSILHSRQGNLKSAKKLLKKAQEIAEISEKPLQKLLHIYTKGVYEAASGKKEESIETFEELVKGAKENGIFEMLVRGELELARTYMKTFSESKDIKDLARALYHLEDLIQIAEEQGAQSLYAEALLLRSDIRNLSGEEFEAKGDIERVLSIASFLEDSRLESEAQRRLEPVKGSEKAGKTGIDKMMNRAMGFKTQSKVKDVPRPVIHALLALDRGSGLPEFVHYFREIGFDSSIVSGFISAISSFTKEFMGDKGLIRSINHEGFTVMIEHAGSRIVTLIVDQETFDVRYHLHEFAKRFDDEFAPVEEGEGIASADYEGAVALVEEIFAELI